MSTRRTKKPIHLGILQAEAKVKNMCREKNKLENYIEPPLIGETQNQRTVRRKKIRDSLLDGDEQEKQRSKNKLATQKRRLDAIQNVNHHFSTPSKSTKKNKVNPLLNFLPPTSIDSCTGHTFPGKDGYSKWGHCDTSEW